MIGKLRGIIDEIEQDSVILDVGGVGYHVFCSSRTLASLPAKGNAAELIIETHVREEHIHLYGFPDTVEREWFRLLTTVQRVGNKMALSILSAYGPSQLAHAILAKDTTAFSRIKGIGAGLAERIVTELKDKVSKMPVGDKLDTAPLVSAKKSKEGIGKIVATSNQHEDTISALVNLGYSRSEAYTAALKAGQSEVTELDQLIKLSLKELARG